MKRRIKLWPSDKLKEKKKTVQFVGSHFSMKDELEHVFFHVGESSKRLQPRQIKK